MSPAERKNTTLIMGVGNPYRGDDRVGLAVIEKLKEKNLPGMETMEAVGEGTALMDVWRNYKRVFLVDAVDSGEKPGIIHRFDVQKEKIPAKFFHYSTHAFGVAEAVELARSLSQLPEQFIVFGIQGKNFSSGTKLSKEVERAVGTVVDDIEKEVLALRD
jgi:hydrogenase maturation protease